MQKYGFSLPPIFTYKDRIVDSFLTRENVGQQKSVFSHILQSEIKDWIRIYGTKYSRTGQVKFVQDSLKNLEKFKIFKDSSTNFPWSILEYFVPYVSCWDVFRTVPNMVSGILLHPNNKSKRFNHFMHNIGKWPKIP